MSNDFFQRLMFMMLVAILYHVIRLRSPGLGEGMLMYLISATLVFAVAYFSYR